MLFEITLNKNGELFETHLLLEMADELSYNAYEVMPYSTNMNYSFFTVADTEKQAIIKTKQKFEHLKKHNNLEKTIRRMYALNEWHRYP